MARQTKAISRKGTRISRNEAEQFVVLYNQLGTYKAVADIMGRCPDAVSKWIKILQAESSLILK